MKIAQLVLPWLPIPPPGYAGTERVVTALTEGLVKRGHEVTLFSVGESKTSAKLEAILPKALGLQSDVMGSLKTSFYPLMHVAHCFARAHAFDVIHSHAQFLGLPFADLVKRPSVHTFHRVYAFQTPDEEDLVKRYGHLNFTSISNAQRVPGVNFIATVYNGIDTDVYTPTQKPTRDYLLWAGRLIDKKGPEEAIRVAKAVGMPIVMAGEMTELAYFEERIRPHVDGRQVRLAGDQTPAGIVRLYQNAKVTIVPTKWNEPFGLVPVESMACGTPVVGYARGGVVETVAPGTGFLTPETDGVKGLVEKVNEILALDENQYAALCTKARHHVEKNFSVEKMVEGYEAVYRKILSQKT